MVLMSIDISILFLALFMCYSSLSGRAYSLGAWHYKVTNQYKYWEAIASYAVFLGILFFIRHKLML
jgi:hypothetical protein